MHATTERQPTIGFPAESAAHDPRVILTPELAGALRRAGFEPLTESGVGAGVGLGDDEYRRAGATIGSPEQVWQCPLLLKYKAFSPAELARLEPGRTVGAVFHAEGSPNLISALTASRVRAYSYEFLSEDGRFPLMRPGGHIAGVQAVLLAAQHLQTSGGGRGVLLAGVPGVPAPRMVVIGTGNVGTAAARTAAALGAEVVALARDERGRVEFLRRVDGVTARVNDPVVLRAELSTADAVVGAILVSTYSTPPMITEEDLELLRPGSVIVDATCGYGPGYLPTAGPVQRPGDPPHVVAGVLHVKIDVLPSTVPVTATLAYAANAAPYLVRLAEVVLRGAVDPAVESARIAEGGAIVHPVVAEHADLYQDAR